MNLAELKQWVEANNIQFEINNQKLTWSNSKGQATPELISSIRKYKQELITWLQTKPEPEEEFLTNVQQIELLASWGYERELAELIIWAWENDHKWPISSFSLSDGRVIETPKEFYMNEIGLSIADPANAKLTRQQLKTILADLKNIVDNELVPA